MEFKEYKLSDLTINGKGEYGIGASAVEYNPSLYRYLRITDIDDNGFINTDELKSVNDKNAENYLLKENEIVFARTGNSTGKSYFYNGEDGPLVFAGFLIRFKLDSKKVNPKFIRYYTLSENYKGWINQFATGSTRKNINAKTYGNMIIKLPPRSYQNYIVQILDSLEEKLKENKKIIANLEELSQILFKRWFVDFEFPDENGNSYKSSGGEMIDSELGKIPKSWKVDILGNYIKIKSGKRPKCKVDNKDFENVVPVIGASKIMGYTNDYIYNEKIIIIGRVGTHGVIQRFSTRTWPSDNTFVITSDFESIIYQLLKSIDYISLNRGSTQPLLSQKDIKSTKVAMPTNETLLYKYQKENNHILKMMDQKNIENQKLTQLRDTLLPKLMSGEIEIPDDIEVNEDDFSI